MSTIQPHSEIPAGIPDLEFVRRIGSGSYGEVWLARGLLGEDRAVKVVRQPQYLDDRPSVREFEGLCRFEPISRGHEGLVHVLHAGRFEGGFYYVMELADDAQSAKGDPVTAARGAELKTPDRQAIPTAAVGGVISQTAAPASEGSTTLLDSPSRGGVRPESIQAPPAIPGNESQGLNHGNYVARTLREEVRRRGRVPAVECIEIALQLAQALEYLHARSLVHRDVKPSNIIFVRGRAKLADIGLVATTDGSHTYVGTEGFLPPEGPGKPQGDIYALGKVLYEASTGRDRQDYPELPTLLRDDPQRQALQELNEIILDCCESDPRRRYATASALRADLELLHAGHSLQQRRRKRRHFEMAWRCAGVAAAALFLALMLRLPLWRGAAPEPAAKLHAMPNRLLVPGADFWRVPQMARKFDFSPDGRRLVFADTNGISLWERETGTVRRLVRLQDLEPWRIAGLAGALAMPRWAPDGRHLCLQAVRIAGGSVDNPVLKYTVFRVDADTSSTQRFACEFTATNKAQDLAWRPGGDSITLWSADGNLVNIGMDGEPKVWDKIQLPPETSLILGGYSIDGKWLLFRARPNPSETNSNLGCQLYALRQGSGQPVHLAELGLSLSSPAWGGELGEVYFVADAKSEQGILSSLMRLRLDPVTMKPRLPPVVVLRRSGSSILHPRWVKKNNELLYAVEEPQSEILTSSANLTGVASVAARGHNPVLAPDGETIYFVGQRIAQQGVFAIHRNGAAATLRRVTDLVPSSRVTADTRGVLSLSPNGSLIAFFATSIRGTGVHLVPARGGTARLIQALPETSGAAPMWSPDGMWLAYSTGRDLVRQSPDGRQREVLSTMDAWHGFSVRWSPDGRHIAAFARIHPSGDKEHSAICAVDVNTRQVRELTTNAESQWKEGLEWHPSGEFLTYMVYGPGQSGAQIRRAFLDARPAELMIDQEDHWDYIGVWAPDGLRYYFSSGGPPREGIGIHVFDLRTGAIDHQPGLIRQGRLPNWSHNGRFMAWATGTSDRYFESIQLAVIE